jgi:glycosyltransferase involved in cell wall biosynthesis
MNDRAFKKFPKTATVPTVSIIIAVYKKPEFLEKVLISLTNQTFKDFEAVIADDGSGPEIPAIIKRFENAFSFPTQHIWQEDRGFRKTVIANKAVIAAHADYLIFIDGDCILHHRFIESHFSHRQKRAVMAGRRVMLDKNLTDVLTNKDIASRRIERPGFWWRHCASSDRKHGLYISGLFWLENALKKNYSFYGSNFSIFKEDFIAVNGYDERIIGRGIEDDNLRERLKLNGIVIRCVTRTTLQYHLYHSSDPVPHDPQTIRDFCYPKKAWAEDGIQKGGKPLQ